MRKIISILFMLSASPLLARECPVEMGNSVAVDDVTTLFERGPAGYVDRVANAIKEQSSCNDGVAVAETCALGSSADQNIAVVAERKCGLDFWNKLTSAEKVVYNGLQGLCNKKYENMQGTMYISFAAFCRLDVAKLYSQLYTPAESE